MTSRAARQTRHYAAFAATIGYAAMFLLYVPIVGLVLLSFSAQPLAGVPWPLTLDWYTDLFAGDVPWLAPTWTSILVGLAVSLLSTVAATLVGRQLPQLRRRNGLLLTFMVVIFLPGMVIGFAILMFYRAMLGIRTGIWSLLLAHFAWAFPFSLLCVLLVTVRFDVRLVEAAKDLGANAWQRFFQIELPLLKPGIVASLFFGFLLSFNELPRTIYARGAAETLPYFLWTQSSGHISQISLVYALSAIITVISLGLTAVAVSFLMRGEE